MPHPRPAAARLAVLLVLPLAALPARLAGGPAAGADVATRARAAYLAAEAEAARSHSIYLVLDPRGGGIDLKVDGLLLRRFAVAEALFGSPRLASDGPRWPAWSFELETELPEPDRPRIPIQSPEPAPAAAAPGAPKPAAAQSSLAVSEARREALEQMPTHYRLRFAPPLDLSVRGEAGAQGLPARLWRLPFRLLEGWRIAALRATRSPVPPRVVLVLTPDEARRLFMTLDPKMRLLVYAPPPGR